MKLTFPLGFALVLLGLALACLVNYWDKRRFQSRLDRFLSSSSVSAYSGIYQSIKSNDQFAQKYMSSEASAGLLHDYSTVDLHIKSVLQNICDEVSKKKSDAFKNIDFYLFLAGIMFVLHSTLVRKSQAGKI
jgi:hypothetical protein